ncbi:DotU family type IV/VI secretion system protein [Arenibaculum pallidiluteum]|uniref:DotU family type IV/VI secretion system protein n=1 Tax=Arenibaculum pallidiluteum TaxID=2812559 RepID=UPI001A962AA6|nr:DotU family type IV/VI secretion system protein [Arenibaculum pallidiluteum]
MTAETLAETAPAGPASADGTRLMDLFRAVHGIIVDGRAAGIPGSPDIERVGALLREAVEQAPQNVERARAVFAIAAYADETFAAAGAPSDLKALLFGPNATVELLFRHINDLLRRGSSEPDLASVYLAVLTLGFPAAQAAAGQEAASGRRLQLHHLLSGEKVPATRISAQAYAQQDGAAAPAMPARLPSSRGWWGAVAATFLAFLVASHLVWTGATAGIARDLAAARAIAENQGLTWSR